MIFKNIIFSCAVRGYHFCRNIWNSTKENFFCSVTKSLEKCLTCLLYHAMMLKVEQFLFANGNIKSSKICFMSASHHALASANTRYWQSPLLQGGLEVLCIVIVGVLGTITNNRTLGKYTEFVNIVFKDLVESLFRSSFIEDTDVRSTADFSRKRDSKCQSKKRQIKNGTKIVMFVEYFLTLTADVNQRDF